MEGYSIDVSSSGPPRTSQARFVARRTFALPAQADPFTVISTVVNGSDRVDAWGRLNVRFSHSKPPSLQASKPQVRFRASNKTFIEAPQNVRYLRYLLDPIDETNGTSAILGS